MDENLGHNRTKEIEVRRANISKESETTSLEDFIVTVGVNIGFLQQGSKRAVRRGELKLGRQVGTPL